MRLLPLLLLVVQSAAAAEVDVWIGTTTGGDSRSRGIYHLTLDEETGSLSASRLAAEAAEPGFVALSDDGRRLYAVGDAVASVVAYAVEPGDEAPTLRRLNAQPTGDGGACHVSLDHTGRVLLSAQYGGGSVASYPIREDGSIGPRASLVEHTNLPDAFGPAASGVVASRQEAPHPHWTGVSPDNRFVLAPDLGGDRIVIHRLDAASAELTPHGAVATSAGGGPRHFAFHPDGERGYVVDELAMTLSAFAYDAGSLTLLQTVPTLSARQKADERFNSGSEVRVHPSGDFVYTANRGHDSITVFRVDGLTGELRFVETEPIRGSWPRNFALSPSGRWLLAAGRDSNSLAVFAIDTATGELQYTLRSSYVPSPICVAVAGASGD